MSKKISTYIISILLILGGLTFIIRPEQTTSSIIHYIGLTLVIVGIFKMISYFLNRNVSLIFKTNLISGITNLIFGILIMNNTNIVSNTLSLFIGIWLLINSISNLIFYFYKKNFSIIDLDKNFLINNIIKLIAGIVVLSTPIITILFTGYVLGIILILIGIYNLYNFYRNQKVYKIKVK